jgi:subtilisin family serine protease
LEKCARAHFSNWGPWLECATRGEDIVSAYIFWQGSVEGEPHEDFRGWARWDGTSFAAPKVSAAIARELAENPNQTPLDAFQRIVTGQTQVDVDPVTDYVLTPFPGVTLPQLHIW